MYKANIFHDRVLKCKRFRYFSKEISNTYIAHVPGYPLTTLHTHTYSYIYIYKYIYTWNIYTRTMRAIYLKTNVLA